MYLYVMTFLLLATPAWASDGVLLNVNQTHSLSWNWEETEGPVRSFVFRCGDYMKEVVDADARSLRFGSFIDDQGKYAGCTLAARNEAGLSAPVILPDFSYTYSYKSLGLFMLELLGTIAAVGSILAVASRSLLGAVRRRKRAAAPLALPEPLIILEKAREHADRYY